jgi:hypothetical protein
MHASTHHFSVHSHDMSAALTCTQLPGTAAGFCEYLDNLCPKFRGSCFRLESRVWPMSPYAIIPNKFATDISFRSIPEAGNGGSSESSEIRTRQYQSLLNGCREFARSCPKRLVEFEIKIFFFKEGTGTAG